LDPINVTRCNINAGNLHSLEVFLLLDYKQNTAKKVTFFYGKKYSVISKETEFIIAICDYFFWDKIPSLFRVEKTSFLKMLSAGSSENLEPIYQIIWHHISEHRNIDS
jgi:hypothetical protein